MAELKAFNFYIIFQWMIAMIVFLFPVFVTFLISVLFLGEVLFSCIWCAIWLLMNFVKKKKKKKPFLKVY